MSTLLRETQPAQNRIAGYLPQHADANGNYVATGDNEPMPVKIQFVKGMVPVQFQETLRSQDTVFSIAAQAVTANTWKQGEWVDVSGYDSLSITAISDGIHSLTAGIDFSHDRSAVCATGNNTVTTMQFADYQTTVKARYARVSIKNGDTANPHTMSGTMYRKS